MTIFTKITLLLCVYLTSLQKNFWLACDIADSVCFVQGLVKSETTFKKSIRAGTLIGRR